MSNKDNGGPAFPGVEYKAPVGGGSHMMTIVGGMSMRDYFAAKALQGDMASGVVHSDEFQSIAARAYKMADAMLEARKQ